MSNEEVKVLLENLEISKIKEGDAQEVVGCFEVLELIFENYNEIEITESNIKNLHDLLLKYIDKDRWHKGDYKQHSNVAKPCYLMEQNRLFLKQQMQDLKQKMP